MDYTKICRIFAKLAGISSETAVQEIELVRLAEKSIMARLKDKSTADEHIERINYAIAADAFYRYAVLHAFEGPDGTIQLGAVKIQQDAKGTVERAASIRDACLAEAADLLADPREFYFKQVNDHVH